MNTKVIESLELRGLTTKLFDILDQHSECIKRQVACILFDKDYRILTYGFNHSLNGHKCNECFSKNNNGIYTSKFDNETHKEFSKKAEIHAEVHAISSLFKIDCSKLDSISMLVNFSPCDNCMKLIKYSPITKIYYLSKYHESYLFDLSNIEKIKVTLKGNIHHG